MKTLGLLRHAKSDWDDLALRDFDRGLNGRGRRGAALMGQHIRQYGLVWDAVLASPAERVRRTIDAAGLGRNVQWDQRAYLADRDTLIALLAEQGDDTASTLLVGHNPGMQELAVTLVAPQHENALLAEVAQKYPTATFAVLELDIDRWRDCAPGCGRLVHLSRPRDLDAELGPTRMG